MFFGGPLWAQMENHYIPGTNGLNSAVRPTQGFTYNVFYTHYHAEKIKNKHGKKGLIFGDEHHLNSQFLQNFFSFYTPIDFLGGYYGFQVDVPFVSSAMDVIVIDHSFDVSNHSLSLSDIYVEPINIRYDLGQYHFFIAYGLWVPNGKFHGFSTKNVGYGNWGHMFSAAGTWFLDCANTWSVSAYTTYEFHSKKRYLDFKPGQNLCIDWGIGKTFGRYFTLGAVGYIEQQTTLGQGYDVPFHSRHAKDQVVAIGGEFDVVVPQINFGLLLRAYHEVYARCRTEGNTFVLSGSIVY